jgi:hypothetical protein
MVENKKRKPPGLSAIKKSREDRASGRGRWTAQGGLVALGAIVLALVAHKIVSEREMASGRQALLAKQRAVVATLGQKWFPLRDRIEGFILGASGEYQGDMVDPQARTGAFKTEPGLYLRMRLAEAKSADAIRNVAADARKDAFPGCLLHEPNPAGARGEVDGGAFPEQPWNLGRAYAATRILNDDWGGVVKDADDDLQLRLLEEQYDDAMKGDIPLAIDVVQRAQFLLLALDEDVPAAAAYVDGGTFTEEALQMVAHPTRVHLFDLASGREILRLRRVGEASVIPAGEHVVTDAETRDAEQRQANNCALARRVDEALAATAAK